jgi:hypothetical protein
MIAAGCVLLYCCVAAGKAEEEVLQLVRSWSRNVLLQGQVCEQLSGCWIHRSMQLVCQAVVLNFADGCLESVFFLCVAQTLMYMIVYYMHTKALVCSTCAVGQILTTVCTHTLWLVDVREWAAHCAALAAIPPTTQTMRATREEVCSCFCMYTTHHTSWVWGQQQSHTNRKVWDASVSGFSSDFVYRLCIVLRCTSGAEEAGRREANTNTDSLRLRANVFVCCRLWGFTNRSC